MDSNRNNDFVTPYRLGSLMSGEGYFYKLLVGACHEVGPASQTLGAILSIAGKDGRGDVFMAVDKLASKVKLKAKTTRNQLTKLMENGWIENHGREMHRRTCTYRVTQKTIDYLNQCSSEPRIDTELHADFDRNFGFLPLQFWASVALSRQPWCVRVTWAAIHRRYRSLLTDAVKSESRPWEKLIDDAEERFVFSISDLRFLTGLSKDKVIEAKRRLARLGVITQKPSTNSTQILSPVWNFKINMRHHDNGLASIIPWGRASA